MFSLRKQPQVISGYTLTHEITSCVQSNSKSSNNMQDVCCDGRSMAAGVRHIVHVFFLGNN